MKLFNRWLYLNLFVCVPAFLCGNKFRKISCHWPRRASPFAAKGGDIVFMFTHCHVRWGRGKPLLGLCFGAPGNATTPCRRVMVANHAALVNKNSCFHEGNTPSILQSNGINSVLSPSTSLINDIVQAELLCCGHCNYISFVCYFSKYVRVGPTPLLYFVCNTQSCSWQEVWEIRMP